LMNKVSFEKCGFMRLFVMCSSMSRKGIKETKNR
jgi:hypothetical protein